MTTVLVPLDGSSASERALAPARSLARRVDADLVLARSSWDSTDSEVMQYLDGLVDSFHLDADTTKRVAYRFPADAVADLASEYPDPVLCMASSGRRGLAHVVLGSASEEIMAASPVAILACGPHVEPATLELTRIGLCVDGGTHETAVVQFCVHWARRLAASVDVVTVQAEDDRPLSRFNAASPAQIAGAVSLLHANDIEAVGHELEELQPARCLAGYARAVPLALLVAAKRSGASGLGREALGSTVMSLIHQAPCPVLLPAATWRTD